MTSLLSAQASTTDVISAARVIRYELTGREVHEVLSLARQWLAHYGDASNPDLHVDSRVLAAELPCRLRSAVNTARLDDRLHALIISGIPVSETELEPTPLHWTEANTSGSQLYGMILVLYAALLGDVIGWATQQHGRVVTDVLPIPGYEDSLVSSCSEQELGWHIEDAFSACRADYVGLLCLRSPEAIPTTLAGLDPQRIPAGVAAVLAQKRFVILPDSSHDPANNTGEGTNALGAFERLDQLYQQQPPKVAVLSGAPDAPVLRVDRDFTVAQNDDSEAAWALQWLISHLDGNLYDVVLEPGDVAFVDNRNAVHGRRAFSPRYDGQDRWLKRVNVVTDLRRTRPGRHSAVSRVIA